MADEEKVKRLRQLLRSVLESKHADLRDVLEHGSLCNFSQLMLSTKLITKDVNNKPDFNNIIGSFIALMNWKETQDQLESHCCKFLDVLNNLGLEEVARRIKDAWRFEVNKVLGITILLEKPLQVMQGLQQSPRYQFWVSSAQLPALRQQFYPVQPPKTSLELERSLRRNSELSERITSKVAHNQRIQSSNSLAETWSQELYQRQPPSAPGDYLSFETTQASEIGINNNPEWLPSHNHNPVLRGGKMVAPNDIENNVIQHTDPVPLVRGGEGPVSDQYNYSEVIPGSDIIPSSMYYGASATFPSRSSTNDTVTPLVIDNSPHPLSTNPVQARPPRLSLTHGRSHPPSQDGSPVVNRGIITSPSSGQSISPHGQRFPSLATDGSSPHLAEVRRSSVQPEISRPYSQEDKEDRGGNVEMVSGSSHQSNSTSTIKTSEELLLIKSRLAKIESDVATSKLSCARCIEHIQKISERDKCIATLEEKTSLLLEMKKEKCTQLLELKVAFAVLFVLFVAVIIFLAVILTMNMFPPPPPSHFYSCSIPNGKQ